MDVFAYCCASFEKSVTQAAGVKPLLSPPTTMTIFPTGLLMGRDFLYFKLHGLQNQPYWYGDNWTSALSVAQIRKTKLKGTVVFVTNCFFEQSPFLHALLETGAHVFGGSGPNFAQANGLTGADLLGRAFRRAYETGRHSPARAFALARESVTETTTQMQKHTKRAIPTRRASLEARIAANLDALTFKEYKL